MPTVYVTAPRADAAEIGETLVEERLAACVNAVDCASTYRWDGEVHRDDETILLIKTTDERYPDLVERIEALHPYDVPCIERFDEDDESDAFADWREESVR
ncbi:MAG: divalent-cation tolerance protein CutA [Haloarculaceae archaeon]